MANPPTNDQQAAAAAARALPAFWTPATGGAVYVQNDHVLRLAAYSSLAGVTLAIEATLLTPEGRIETIRQEHSPASTRVVGRTLVRMREGWLLAGHVRAIAGTPRRGQVFVRVELAIGQTGDVQPVATLAQGYVSESSWLAWPNGTLQDSIDGRGNLRSFVGTDPAAGVEISETVPDNARWRLILLTASLIADATVITRSPALAIDDGTNVFYQGGAVQTVVAGGGILISWGHGVGFAGSVVNGSLGALPVELMLGSGYRIRTTTANLQAGDNWGSPKFLVEEWIED